MFQLHADSRAKSWLQAHAQPESLVPEPLVIEYEVHRCCGGGKICQVKVRPMSRNEEPAAYASGVTEDGGRVLIDRRAAARLPARFGLTVRGLGPLKHLELDLDAEDWGELLYT